MFVVVSSQNGWNYSVSVTSYLEVARPFYQTSQCRIVLAHVQWFNLNCVNLRNLFIPDPTAGNTEEVSEVNEEDNILFDQEAIGEEESRKKNLALKVKDDYEVVLFMCLF